MLSFGAESFVFQLLSKDLKIKICRTVILPVVLFGYDTLSLTLREEHRLRVFENRVLRIFGPKRDEVTESWRKLHNEELNDLYFSPSIVRIRNVRIFITYPSVKCGAVCSHISGQRKVFRLRAQHF